MAARMEEVEIPAPQYSTKFECEVCDGTWNAPESVTDGEHVGCTIKVLRRDRGTQLKVGEPTLIEGVTELKIISEKMARNLNPDYFFVTPWGFIKEFIHREKKWLKNGGTFIVPFPKFKLIKYNE